MKLEDAIQQKRFASEKQKLAVNILYTGGWIHGHQVRLLKPSGLSPQQYNILRILRGQHPHPSTVQLIKERMLDQMSNVSRLVEKLRQKGFVERRPCEQDRRAVDVFISREGLSLLDELENPVNDFFIRFETLSDAEATTLNNLLDKLRS